MENNYTQPIRVLHVIGAMDLGGAEAMIMELYRKIDRERIQFDFLVQTPKKCAYDNEIESMGGRIFHIKRFKGYNSVFFYKECSSFFRDHPEIKIVHGHIGSSAALYLLAAKKEGKRTIAHSHSAVGIRNFHDFFYKIFSFPTRYISEYLFGCSTEAGIARFGRKSVTQDNYYNFHNAINAEEYYFDPQIRFDIRQELGFSNEDLIIGTVGKMTQAKNPDFIIDIFEEVSKKDGKCIWVGNGELFNYCRNIVKEKQLEDSVLLTGRRDDIHRVLQAFDGFILPSLWEGLPVVAVEAQAAGLPCLISDVVSHETSISDLVKWESLKTNATKWAEEIIRLAKINIPKRESPINSIRENGYDIEYTAKWLADFYCNSIVI